MTALATLSTCSMLINPEIGAVMAGLLKIYPMAKRARRLSSWAVELLPSARRQPHAFQLWGRATSCRGSRRQDSWEYGYSATGPKPLVGNLDDVKEQTVEGHPTSVHYKLLIGPHAGTRDLINASYVVVDTFLMDFAPGDTNFPHHHLTAEEIYLVLDGQGRMVAGSGMDGIEGRYPAKAGDAYYFRPNCTVGFYNSDRPGAKAHILAVHARVLLPKEAE